MAINFLMNIEKGPDDMSRDQQTFWKPLSRTQNLSFKFIMHARIHLTGLNIYSNNAEANTELTKNILVVKLAVIDQIKY